MRPMSFEEAQAVANSNIWEYVIRELDYRIDMYEKQLRTCGQEDFRELQIKIQGFEELKRLPSDVKGREEDSVPDRPYTGSQQGGQNA